MLKNSLSVAIAAFLTLAVFSLGNSLAAEGQGSEAHGKLYHVVSIKFKDSATPDQIGAVEQAFRQLRDKVPGITSLTWGTNVSPEKRNKGFTHCFVLTFAKDKDRDAYLVHPEHRAFGKVLGPVLDDVMVIDFWGKD
jgi:hypothetical protein